MKGYSNYSIIFEQSQALLISIIVLARQESFVKGHLEKLDLPIDACVMTGDTFDCQIKCLSLLRHRMHV